MKIKGLILLTILLLSGCETTSQTSVDVMVNPYDLQEMQIRVTLKGASHG